MKRIVLTFLTLIFCLLSIIHFYWGFGGKWGFQNTLPTNQSGARILNPTVIDSLIVGAILAGFSFFYLNLYSKTNLFVKFFRFFIPTIFILRAIGDFKFIGFFKTIVNTHFAYLDTFFYSPLCLFIGFTGFYLIFKK